MLRRQLCAFLLLTAILQVEGATVTWVGPSGDWSAAANWSTGSLPGPSDDVMIPTGTSITVTHSTGTDSINSIVCNQTFTLSGGSLSVTTTLQANGPMNLSGGTLINTTVQANGGSLVVSSGTLDGVTVSGTLDVGNAVSGAILTVQDGLTLNGTMLVGNPTNYWSGYASFVGSQALEGNGTIICGNSGNDSLSVANAGTTLVIGPGITVHGQYGTIGAYAGASDVNVANQGTISADVKGGTITIAGTSFDNQGALEAQNGGTLAVNDMAGNVGQVSLGAGSTLSLNGGYTNNLVLNVPASAVLNLAGTWVNSGAITSSSGTAKFNGTWSNTGEIEATGGSALYVGGSFDVAMLNTLQVSGGDGVYITGTLNNSNTTAVFNGAGVGWYLYGGTIVGGTVVATNGSLVVIGGALDGVTINGVLDVGNALSGPVLTVEDGLILNGTMLVGNPTNGWYGTVSFAGSQILNGNGTVTFGNSGANNLSVANAGTTLVIGTGITVHGQYGTIGASAVNVANQGTISADVNTGVITIAGTSFDNQGTLEAQNGGTLAVNDMAGNVGQVSLGAGSTLSLNGGYTNNLVLNVPASAVLNLAGTWVNSGAITSSSGTAKFNGTWSNTGEIEATGGSALYVGGSFDVAMLNTLQVSGGDGVYITGTLNNSNTTAVFNGAGVGWYLYGGTIVGGTVVATNGSLVVIGGALDGVTINGVLDVGNALSGPVLTVEDGLILNGTMLVGNPTNGWYGTVSFAGSQILNGNGTVTFGNSGANNLSVANAGTTLVIGTGITVHGQYGTIGASAVNVANQGTISADVNTGVITIAGTSFDNQGTLEAQNGGTLNVQDMAGNVGQVSLGAGSTLGLNGVYTNNLVLNVPASAVLNLAGTWVNSGAITSSSGTAKFNGTWSNTGEIEATGGSALYVGGSFDVAMLNTLQVSGGDGVYITGTLNNSNTTAVFNGAGVGWYLYGGTIVGGTVVATNGSLVVIGGALDGVTINGVLDVGNALSGPVLTVEDGLILNGTMLVGNPTNGWYGTVSFAGSQILNGNGTVTFGNSGANNLSVANAGTTLVIGTGITVHGQYGTIGASAVNVANQGTISADVNTGVITIAGTSFDNQGTLEAQNGGTLNVQDMAGNVGQVSLGAGSTLGLNGVYTNNLVLNVPASAVLNLAGTWVNSGAITSSSGTAKFNGTWSNTGEIEATGGSALYVGGSFDVAMLNTLQVSGGDGVYITGTLNNSNTTAVFNGAGVGWYLYGGTIVGGTVVATNGSLVVIGGALDGVTINGVLDVGNALSGPVLTVEDGLILNGTMLVGNPTNGWYGTVSFAGSQILNGNGTVTFGNSGANNLSVANAGTTLVIGTGITVHGQYGTIGASAVNVANQGTISADVNTGVITIAGTSFDNQGTLEAQNGGTIVPNSGTTTNSGFIVADSGTITFANAFTQTVGTLDFGLSSPSAFGRITFNGAATLGGTLAAHLDGTNTPNIGDSFAVLSYGSNPLSFTNVDLPSSNDWQTNATNGTLTLVAGIVRLNSVTVSPSNSVVPVGSTVTLVATVTGPGPLTFQWLQNGANIAGATNSTLVLSNVAHSNTGAYTVVVADPGGSLSGVPVQVLVLAPPVLVSPPPSQTDLVGSVVNLNVMVSADQPLSYQWLFNGAKVAGATNSDLTFGDITRAQAGTYEVVVSNPVGVVTSTPPAVLTVVTPPVCPSAPSGMVAWWRGNGDTSDYAGTNDAVFEGTAAYAPGEVGQAFSFDGASSYLQVPNSPAWDFATNDFSIEFWANFAQVLPSLIAGDESIVFLAHDEESDTPNKWIFGLGGGKLYLYINSSAAGPQFLVQAPFGPQTNQWYHLSVTKASGALTIYVNGKQISAATNNLAIPTADAPLTIGQAEDFFMKGLMDEISIYDRALTAVEIAGIYEAGAAGKCPSTQPLAISAEGFNSAGQFKFQILGGQSGAALQVQASSDLANWSNIWQTIRSSGSETFIDTNSTLNLTRFYRANISQ